LQRNSSSSGWIAGAVFGRYAAKILVPAHQDGHFYRKPEPTLDDNRALVVWHFTIDGKGTVDTMGPVVALAPDDTYPQTVIGSTGQFKSIKGEATTTILSASGFQFRLTVSNGKK